MGSCISKTVKLENEVFGMLEFIAEKDPNEACKYADGFLKKKLKPAHSTQLNDLKTRIVRKAVGIDILGDVLGGISSAVMKTDTVADIVGAFSGVANTVSEVVGAVDNVANTVSEVVGVVDNVTNTVSEVVGAVDNVTNTVSEVVGAEDNTASDNTVG